MDSIIKKGRYDILVNISNSNISDLIKKTNLSPTGINYAITQFVAMGLIKIDRVGNEKRINLTEKGSKMKEELIKLKLIESSE